MGHGRVVVVVIGLFLALPGVALAAVVSRNTTTQDMTYVGTGADDLVTIDDLQDVGMNPVYGFVRTAPTVITAGPGCEPQGQNVICSK